MTNNFSVVKLKAQSRKIILVRMKPARGVEYDLELFSVPSIYQMTFPFDSVCGVVVNSIVYTKVDVLANDGEYTFDKETRLLQIYLDSAVESFQGPTGAIMVQYYLYYTNDIGVYSYSDPDDDTSDIVYYEPRVNGIPTFSISQENILEGILSVGNMSLTLKNQDNDFQKFLTDRDSFYKVEFKAWQALDSLDNILKMFFGYISSISVSSYEVHINCDNIFGKLDSKYIANSTLELSTYSNPLLTVSPDDIGKSILKLFCKVSKSNQSKQVELTSDNNEYFPRLGSSQNLWHVFDIIHKAVNIDFSETISKTTNRIWGCCIATADDSDLIEVITGVVTTVLIGGVGLTKMKVDDASYYFPGDNIITGYGVTNDINNVLAIDINDNFIYVREDPTIANGQSIYRPSISVVQIKVTGQDQGRLILAYGIDYTIANINNIRCIILEDNFENNYSGIIFDQSTGINNDSIVEFRAWNHDDLNHSIVLQEIIESAGLSVNQNSFDDAYLTDIKTNFTVPYWGREGGASVRDIIQDLITSTFSYISINNNHEITYQNFYDSFNPAESITENELLKSSLSQEIDYKDIYSQFVFNNDHEINVYWSPDYASKIRVSASVVHFNKRAVYYYGIEKTKNITYITEDVLNNNIGLYISLLSGMRRAKLSFASKGINFETILGDEIDVESSKVIGINETKGIKLISIERSTNETQLTGIDMFPLFE